MLQDWAVGLACETACVDSCVEPGTYYIIITTNAPLGTVTCANSEYVMTLDCEPCLPCPECDPLIAFQEGETCPNIPDTYNGGCLSGVEYVTPIHCGENVCGTSWGVLFPPNPYIFRDRDIYELVLTQYDSVVWTVHANVSTVIEIIEPLPGCSGGINWASSFLTNRCDTITAGVCLPPGRYWLSVIGYPLAGYCEPYTANVQCYPCSECVECPVSSIPEGEPCPNFNDQYNAGCHSTPASAVRIQCEDTICGSSTYYDLPDHDFYEITITSRDTVTWCVEAEFPVSAAIFTPNTICSSMITHAQGNAPACVPLCLSICLPPGTYWLYVRPTVTFGLLDPIACKRYVASVHCAPCPTGQTCGYADLDFDPANDACSFGNIQLHCNDTLCGEIVTGAGAFDQDWYTFQIPIGSPCLRVTMNVYGNDTPGYYPFGQGLDPAIAIYQADCTTLISADNNSGIGNDALLNTQCLPPGYYHIRVGGFQGSMGPYVLALSCGPCPCPPPCPYQTRDFEPMNNTCASAPAEFVCGDTLCGDIPLGPVVDEDWYLFFVFGPNCQRVTVDVFANGTPGYFGYLAGLDPIIELWDVSCSSQMTLDDNSGIANDSRLISACLQPGLYYARVSGVGGTTGPYILATDCQDCSCDSTCPYQNIDFDPANDNCGTTNPMLFCNDTLCADIIPTPVGSPPDRDWYQVTVPAFGCYSLDINCFANDNSNFSPFGGGLDPNLWLYASDCATLLEFDYDSGIGADSRLISGCLSPGVYNILVESVVGTSGPYVLSIACNTCQCPCSLACPVNFPQDGEACPTIYGDVYNGGCNSTPPNFGSIACGSRFCATSWAMGGLRDTDWYQLNLTSQRRIRWRVTAEFPFEMTIYKPNPNCSNLQTISYATGFACQSKQVIKCLAAGTYYFYVAPTVYNGVPCSDYTSRLQCGLCIIHDVVIHQAGTSIQLIWQPDDTDPVYTIHRGSVSEFDTSDDTFIIATTTDPFFEDTDVLQTGAEKYFYIVTMETPEVIDGP